MSAITKGIFKSPTRMSFVASRELRELLRRLNTRPSDAMRAGVLWYLANIAGVSIKHLPDYAVLRASGMAHIVWEDDQHEKTAR